MKSKVRERIALWLSSLAEANEASSKGERQSRRVEQTGSQVPQTNKRVLTHMTDGQDRQSHREHSSREHYRLRCRVALVLS